MSHPTSSSTTVEPSEQGAGPWVPTYFSLDAKLSLEVPFVQVD